MSTQEHRGGGPARRALWAAALVVVVAVVLGVLLLTSGSARRSPPAAPHAVARESSAGPLPAARPFAVRLRVMRFVDRTRRVRFRDGRTAPRTLVTEVRYPSPAGPYPLVVFGHGFNLVPRVYRRLLDAVASAGYVVAAPAFPLERANAPGGPDESDIVNQPRDVSFVISRMLAASAAGGPLSGLIDRRSIAVAGHSDGATTASAVGYDRRYRDPRAGAVVTLAGGFLGGSSPRGAPPLLAAQGTADQVNPPRATYSFYARARRPKYLLRLVGAGHEDPYTREQPQLGVVERTVVAFLDLYLEHRPEAARRLATAGTVRGIARLTSQP